MSHKPEIRAWLAIWATLACVIAAEAQDFPDVQVATNRVLFATQEIAADRRAAEARRIEALDQRTRVQDALLHEQALFGQKLGGELQVLKDERQVIELGAAFDAAVVAREWQSARSLLAEAITENLLSELGTARLVAADAFISDFANSSRKESFLSRSNQQVRFESNNAILISQGLPWNASTSRRNIHETLGEFEYHFVRTGAGWKIDGLSFRRAN